MVQSRLRWRSGKGNGLKLDALPKFGSQTPAGDEIYRRIQQVFQGEFEVHELLEARTAWKIHQQVHITSVLCGALDHRAKDLQSLAAMGDG